MIDLRSDTQTRPTDAVRRAMAAADVGDDGYREDPEAEALQTEVAERFGREAALFVPSGTMANVILLQSLVRPGMEVVCEADAHLVAYEGGAGSLVAGVQFRTIEGDYGRLDVDLVRPRLRPRQAPHVALGAISVEETTNRGGGAIHGADRLRALRALADDRSVPLHGDGARLFNAIVATGTEPEAYGAVFTAFSFCLSKGLGAPVGSVIVGDRDVVETAREWRRRLGGGMRQVGPLAAAGRYVLANHVERLAEDHENARRIAEILSVMAPGSCDPTEVMTNMLFINTGQWRASDVLARLREDNVLAGAVGDHLVRLVVHLDVDRAACERAAKTLGSILAGQPPLQR